MTDGRAEVLVIGAPKAVITGRLKDRFTLHILKDAADPEALLREAGPRIRAAVVTGAPAGLDEAMMAKLPGLQFVASFGVGYDNIGVRYAAAHGITVTHTPEVLNEEVADTALGLLLCSVREFARAERFVRDGGWLKGPYPLTGTTLRNRTVGLIGLGRIGRAIARRLDGFGVPVVYHTRNPVADLPYRHYPALLDMARDVDTLLAIVPGGPATRNMINAEVLAALGPSGIVINMARGSVVDDDALIKALTERTIQAAGLDVFNNEPHIAAEYLALNNVTMFPHLGSATAFTQQQMEELVADNVLAWADGRRPPTPVPETPWPPKAGQASPSGG